MVCTESHYSNQIYGGYSIKGAKLAQIEVPGTGGWNVWKILTATISESVSGVHVVYFGFLGKNITAGRELFNFDYWSFQKK
ncbi:carbohydrate-binding protein [Chryseobacterium populi]|uniref:carbohydrate-binding protein n=1 Tax=Chryseobacterium populi TaxID=1144316 RepID=UPI002934B552|nr:carbohydrate-binding protein [Chryseobacterium populi]